MKFWISILTGLMILSACAPRPAPITTVYPTFSPTQTPLPTAQEGVLPEKCELQPVITPTIPAVIPGYTELDETTGLHVTGQALKIDLESYTLKVSGKVNHTLNLSYNELRCMPKITAEPALICSGVFEDVATWSGVPLTYILGLAGIQEGAEQIELLSADGYKAILLLDEAQRETNFLAYEWEGQPLPILHGFPLRMVAPGILGSNWVKWLVEIVVK